MIRFRSLSAVHLREGELTHNFCAYDLINDNENMEIENESAEGLRNHIANAERKVKELKEKLEKLESDGKAEVLSSQPREVQNSGTSKWPLTAGEYIRYGRQMIVPSIRIEGQ